MTPATGIGTGRFFASMGNAENVLVIRPGELPTVTKALLSIRN
jgi:hypothetical protein